MATLRIQVDHLPRGVMQAQVEQALSQLGKVSSVKLSESTCFAEIESATLQRALDSSGMGEVRLGDMLRIDGSGIGELRDATVSLAGNSTR